MSDKKDLLFWFKKPQNNRDVYLNSASLLLVSAALGITISFLFLFEHLSLFTGKSFYEPMLANSCLTVAMFTISVIFCNIYKKYFKKEVKP